MFFVLINLKVEKYISFFKKKTILLKKNIKQTDSQKLKLCTVFHNDSHLAKPASLFKLVVEALDGVLYGQLVADRLHAQLHQLLPAQHLQVRPRYLVLPEAFRVDGQVEALQPQAHLLHAPHHQRLRSGVSRVRYFFLDVDGGGVAQVVGHPEVGVEVGVRGQVADGGDDRAGFDAGLRGVGCVRLVLVAGNSRVGRRRGFYFVAA